MTIKTYRKGANAERKTVRELKAQGFNIAARTAGSKSPIDIFAINRRRGIILFIQRKKTKQTTLTKKGKIRKNAQRILNTLDYINDFKFWDVKFELR